MCIYFYYNLVTFFCCFKIICIFLFFVLFQFKQMNKFQFSPIFFVMIAVTILCGAVVVALPRLNLPMTKTKNNNSNNTAEHMAKAATEFQHQQQHMSSFYSSFSSSSRSSSNNNNNFFPFLAQGPTPDYVQEASEKARIEYWKIFTDDKGQTSKGELKAMRIKWAECYGMRDEYEMYEEEHGQKTDSFYKLMTANLGGDALKAFKKIWEITHNDDLSRNEECRQAQDVLDGLKLRVRHMIPLLPYGITGIGPAPDCLPSA